MSQRVQQETGVWGSGGGGEGGNFGVVSFRFKREGISCVTRVMIQGTVTEHTSTKRGGNTLITSQ